MSQIGPRPVPWLANLVPAAHGSSTDPAVLDFSANGNVIGPSAAVAPAIVAVDLSRYPDRWNRNLCALISDREHLTEQSVVAGNGSTDLIWAIARAYLGGPEDHAWIAGPTYGEYAVASAAAGASLDLQGIPTNRAIGGPLPHIAASLPSTDDVPPRVLWICHPNNPTGRPFPLELVDSLARQWSETLFVVDEAYLTLSEGVESASPLIEHGNVVILRSLTKDLGLAGLRVGYAMAAVPILDAVRKVLPPWSLSGLAQAGALAALMDADHQARARAAVAASRLHLLAGLRRIGLHPFPTVANFVLVPVGDAPTVHERLLAEGLAVRDCTSFGLPDCIRIGVRPIADQELLLAALKRLSNG